MGSSWRDRVTRRRGVCRQREGTQVDGRRVAAAAQAMVENQQPGIGQALAELAQVMLQHKACPAVA